MERSKMAQGCEFHSKCVWERSFGKDGWNSFEHKKKVRKNIKLPDIFDFLRDHKCITNHHLLERNVGDPLWSSIYASPFTPELEKDGWGKNRSITMLSFYFWQNRPSCYFWTPIALHSECMGSYLSHVHKCTAVHVLFKLAQDSNSYCNTYKHAGVLVIKAD